MGTLPERWEAESPPPANHRGPDPAEECWRESAAPWHRHAGIIWKRKEASARVWVRLLALLLRSGDLSLCHKRIEESLGCLLRSVVAGKESLSPARAGAALSCAAASA